MSTVSHQTDSAAAWARATDPLWGLVLEFGERARAHPVEVETAVLRHLEAKLARNRAALEGLAPGGSREQALEAGAIYRARLEASEPEVSSSDERIAYLARLHDVVIAEDSDGERRENRRPLAPPGLDGAPEVAWALLVLPTDLARIRADLARTGACRWSEYLVEVRALLPLPGEEPGQLP